MRFGIRIGSQAPAIARFQNILIIMVRPSITVTFDPHLPGARTSTLFAETGDCPHLSQKLWLESGVQVRIWRSSSFVKGTPWRFLMLIPSEPHTVQTIAIELTPNYRAKFISIKITMDTNEYFCHYCKDPRYPGQESHRYLKVIRISLKLNLFVPLANQGYP